MTTSGKKAIHTTSAPHAIGPYSQAIAVPAGGTMVFCSGQIALSPATGTIVGPGSVAQQAEQVMQNLGAVLAAAGCTFDDVVKTTIFLTDLGDFATVNEIYGRSFEGRVPPARATVQVSALPRGARFEVDAVMALG